MQKVMLIKFPLLLQNSFMTQCNVSTGGEIRHSEISISALFSVYLGNGGDVDGDIRSVPVVSVSTKLLAL